MSVPSSSVPKQPGISSLFSLCQQIRFSLQSASVSQSPVEDKKELLLNEIQHKTKATIATMQKVIYLGIVAKEKRQQALRCLQPERLGHQLEPL